MHELFCILANCKTAIVSSSCASLYRALRIGISPVIFIASEIVLLAVPWYWGAITSDKQEYTWKLLIKVSLSQEMDRKPNCSTLNAKLWTFWEGTWAEHANMIAGKCLLVGWDYVIKPWRTQKGPNVTGNQYLQWPHRSFCVAAAQRPCRVLHVCLRSVPSECFVDQAGLMSGLPLADATVMSQETCLIYEPRIRLFFHMLL